MKNGKKKTRTKIDKLQTTVRVLVSPVVQPTIDPGIDKPSEGAVVVWEKGLCSMEKADV